MTSLMVIFGLPIAAGALCAINLALFGAQLSSRGQGAQTLVVAQAAALGVIAALGLSHTIFEHPEVHEWLPVVTGLAGAALAYIACDRWIHASLPSRSSFHIGLFALLTALTYTFTALVPELESHMTAQFFGDLAVISDAQAIGLLVAGFLALGFLTWNWRAITSSSFDHAIFGKGYRTRRRRRIEFVFVASALTLIGLSIQYVGLLFTLGSLFLPSLGFVGMRPASLMSFTLRTAFIALLGAVGGFTISLWHGRLPTVPTVVLSYALISALALTLSRIISLVRSPAPQRESR